jgi:hypothetical protein
LMASSSRTASIRSHLLAVACAILGMMLDVMPTPSPWLAGADCPRSGVDSPASPRPEDPEGDETPVEASDLAWPIQGVLVRSTGRSTRPSVTARLARVGHSSRPEARALAVDLPIRLCRLTC